MTLEAIHKKQAEHNENVAAAIDRNHPNCNDWVITTCFYSALHFVEAALARDHNLHTETSVPKKGGQLLRSPHGHRVDLVAKYYKSIFKNYEKLRNASNMARYLASGGIQLNQCAFDYFDQKAATDRQKDLEYIRQQLSY